ncbi:hypothetical protein SAY87_005377 [Trapa incisa]|uniref:Uncharacterized protein n=1 Tax=Trapa incisa TaxID=236973 RepID=A0AAN7K8Q8_9MYRT|nr:hypothetical protein SAY87_005377 [Trapa incisa]
MMKLEDIYSFRVVPFYMYTSSNSHFKPFEIEITYSIFPILWNVQQVGGQCIILREAVAANGVPPWNWRETPGNGGESQLYRGRVIVFKWGDYTRRIGIDCSEESIKEAIKWAFRLRTKRAFWLEDEDEIVINGDQDMPLGNYMLDLDEGLAIKVCIYDESDHKPVRREDKMF